MLNNQTIGTNRYNVMPFECAKLLTNRYQVEYYRDEVEQDCDWHGVDRVKMDLHLKHLYVSNSYQSFSYKKKSIRLSHFQKELK